MALSNPDGRDHIDGVPPGRTTPLAGKHGYDDALEVACAAGLARKHANGI